MKNMTDNCYSLFYLAVPQVLIKEPWSPIATSKIESQFFDNPYPTFSNFVARSILTEMSLYAQELSKLSDFKPSSERAKPLKLARALTNVPDSQEEMEEYINSIEFLANTFVNISAENDQEIDLTELNLFSRLLVEILENQTGNIVVTPLYKIIPWMIRIARQIDREDLLNPFPVMKEIETILEKLYTLAAAYNVVEIPKGYQRIGMLSLEGDFTLPDQFDISGGDKAIPVFVPDSRLINPILFERDVKVEMTPEGHFTIPSMMERPYKYVPPQLRRQFQIIQIGNFLEYVVNEPIHNAKEYIKILKQFLKTMGLDIPGKLVVDGDKVNFTWRHNYQGPFLEYS